MSQAALAWLTTAFTSADFTSAGLSHCHGIAPAVPVTERSIFPQAAARWSLPTSTSAAVIARLIAGSSSCGQLELFEATMFFPLNVGSSIVCGSLKSFSQPTLGQMGVLEVGTLQNFEYMVLRVTGLKSILKPSFSMLFRATCAAAFWLALLSATIRSFGPLYLPFE